MLFNRKWDIAMGFCCWSNHNIFSQTIFLVENLSESSLDPNPPKKLKYLLLRTERTQE